MNREALAVHARLAALPTYRHRAEPEERGPSSLAGYPTEGRKPGRPPPAESRLRVTAKREAQPAVAIPKVRKKRTSFVILNARPNRWGFSRGDALPVADDGKSWAGCRVEYVGTASSTNVYVRAKGMKVSVRADRVRRVA